MINEAANLNVQLFGITNNIERRLRNFSTLTGYPIQNVKNMRKIGPPLTRSTVPIRGSELFVHRLPPDALEDEVFWFFQRAGDIYEIRLMLRPSGFANRGYAFVRYADPEQAQNAITTLSREDFRPHRKILLEKSTENNRLFLSGIPLIKNKAEILEELLRMGVECVVDVIMYKGYKKDHLNRGFVFIEFENHETAATVKREFAGILRLWNKPIILDWAEPLREVDTAVMVTVTRVFIRNLDTEMKKAALIEILKEVLDFHTVEKVYKHVDYSFIHFFSRKMAENGLKQLQEYYSGTDVEVTWSKPPGMAKKRFLPPRMRMISNSYTQSSGKNFYNRMNLKLGNQQLSPLLKEERANLFHKIREEEKLSKESPWLTESCIRNSRRFWSLQDGRIENEVGYRVDHQDSANEKKYDTLVGDTGESSFCGALHHTLNLRFYLDLFENLGKQNTM